MVPHPLKVAACAAVPAILLSGCGSLRTAAPPDEDSPETGVDEEMRPPASGTIVVDACRGESGVAETCTLVTEASACATAPCDRLVVVFSGGEMACDTGAGYRNVLEGYAAHGYAAVCINAFETAAGSGAAPYSDEATRLDLAVREATTGAWAQAYWTGQNLLFEGISHGATAPMILMARTSFDAEPHWQGRSFTAACFFDGSYDQAATADLLHTGAIGGAPCTTPVPYTRWLERYCGPGATDATCDLRTHPAAVHDTITDLDPVTLTIRDFRLVECGSDRPVCSGDVLPAAPIEAVCAAIDASSTHACAHGSLPDDGHLTCHANEFDQCRTWFESQLPL